MIPWDLPASVLLCPAVYMDAGVPNSVLYVCVANTLSAELFLQHTDSFSL